MAESALAVRDEPDGEAAAIGGGEKPSISEVAPREAPQLGFSQEQIDKVTGNLERLTKKKIDEDVRIGGVATAAMDRDRTQMQRAFEATDQASHSIPPQWNADKERQERVRDPIEAFGSVGSVFAMVASAFTRAPMTSALNGAAAAMESIRNHDEKGYASAYQAWKDNTNLAVKRFEMERAKFEDANKLLSVDMNRWVTQTKMNAIEFGDRQSLAMLEAGFPPDKIIELQTSRANAIKAAVEAKEKLEHFNTLQNEYSDSMKAFDGKWQEDHPGDPESMSTPEYWRAKRDYSIQTRVRQAMATKGFSHGAADLITQLVQDDPTIVTDPARAEEFKARLQALNTKYGAGGSMQAVNAATHQNIRADVRREHTDWTEGQVDAETNQREAKSKKANNPLTMDRDDAYQAKLAEIREKEGREPTAKEKSDALAEVTKKQQASRIDQAIINQVPHYPGMQPSELGYITPARQTKLIGAFESSKNLEAIAAYAKEHPQSIGVIAELSRRMNFDAYQGMFKTNPAQAKYQAEKDQDAQIDRITKEQKLDLTQAAHAKVLQKMLTTQAFADAASAGSRGATVYLDRAFKEIYQQASSPAAFFSILEKRYDDSNRTAEEYRMGFDDRDDKENYPFWNKKAAGYVRELGTKGGGGLPPEAAKSLKEGVVTTFGNNQSWTLRGGVPTRVK